MSQELAEEKLIKRYFLGDLPESEQERIQERLFIDQDFFENLLIIEGELVDDYALGLMSELERSKLESGLLKSRHEHKKVNFVKTLEQYITRPASLPVKRKVNEARKSEEDLWERSLDEAHTNRNLIGSLIQNNWLGVELLLQLKAVQQATQEDLASLTERDNSELTVALSTLNDCGLVHKRHGRYSCSWYGSEILEKLQKITARA